MAWVQTNRSRDATLSSNSLRQTVHTHPASLHQAAKLVAALLRVARVPAGLAESNDRLAAYRWVYDSRHLQALTLLVVRQEGHPACKKTKWWGAGVVICLERGADLRMAQLMPLPLTVSCFSKIQIGFTFLVPAHPGSPGQRAVKRVCVSVCVCRPH